jgi:hypothetical protein
MHIFLQYSRREDWGVGYTIVNTNKSKAQLSQNQIKFRDFSYEFDKKKKIKQHIFKITIQFSNFSMSATRIR